MTKAKKKTQKKNPIKNIKGEKTQSVIEGSLPYRLLCTYDKLIPIDELHLNPDNPNDHPETQIVLLAQILKSNGVRRPIRVSTRSGFVTAGHGQILAMRANGWEYAPVDFQDYKSESDEWNDTVADNSIAQLSNLNMVRINDVVNNLGPDYDPTNMGLIDWKVEPADKNGDPQNDEDALPRRARKVKTKLGDIYQMGKHRLLCGDAIEESNYLKLFQKNRAQFCITSPPYDDQRDYGGKLKLDPAFLAQFIPLAKKYCKLFAVNLGMKRKDYEIVEYWNFYIRAAKKSGLKLLSWNIWDRSQAGFTIAQATAMFCIQHEFIFIFGKPTKLNKTVKNKGAGNMSGNIVTKDGSYTPQEKIIKDKRQMGTVFKSGTNTAPNGFSHGGTFPVILPEEYINGCTQKGDYVFEPFAGSGTSLIACEKTERTCLMFELNPSFCDVIVSRWEEYTGKKAKLIRPILRKAKTKKKK